MNSYKRRKLWIYVGLVFLVTEANFGYTQEDGSNLANPPAFEGAQGYGALYTTGGRGTKTNPGRVIRVTNLNDSGSGSLREAVTAQGPRIVIFDVSGNIELNSTLVIRNGDLTIAGQTAPGDGITLKNYDVVISGAQNVVIRYIRFRPGDVMGKGMDALGIYNYKNILIDHVSASWGSDETVSFYTGTYLTIQNSIISEALHDSTNVKGPHSCGGIWGGSNSTFYGNLFAHNNQRNTRLGGHQDQPENMDFRNNVIYNWGANATHGGWNDSTINVVNNYYKSGPATQRPDKFFYVEGLTQLPDKQILDPLNMGKWYVAGNHVDGYPLVTTDNWKGNYTANAAQVEQSVRVNTEFSFAPVYTRTAEEAYAYVLSNVGARSPALDAVDRRILDEVKTRTACYGASYWSGGKGIIDSQNDVGGWPILKAGNAPQDTDKDGMPDEWEILQGLNPQNAADAFNYDTADGYLNIEKYINSKADRYPSIRSHIKMYTSSSGPKTQSEANWLKNHIDMGVAGNQSAAQSIARSLMYVNWSDMCFSYFRGKMAQLSKMFAEANRDQNEMFLHYSSDTKINTARSGYTATEIGVTQASFREDRFCAVFRVSASTNQVADVTYEAYGDKPTQTVPVSYVTKLTEKKGDQLLIGNFFPFSEIHFRFKTPAGTGWTCFWEYWDGSAWKALLVTDETGGMRNNGKINFRPPADWRKNSAVTYGNIPQHMYWVRLRSASDGVQPEVVATEKYYGTYNWEGQSGIYGKAYERIVENEKKYAIVPGWNPENDVNKDGYVDEAEFSSRKDIFASARYPHEAIVPSAYHMNRWVTNLANDIYATYAAADCLTQMNEYKAKGILIDNMTGRAAGADSPKVTYLEYKNTDMSSAYSRDMGNFLLTIKKSLGEGILGTNSGFNASSDVINEVDGIQWESLFANNAWAAKDNDANYFKALIEKIRTIKNQNKYVVISDGPITYYSRLSADIPFERDAMCDLAKYYMIADENTYFNFQDNTNYSHPWNEWFEAIAFNVGKPKGELYLLERKYIGQDDYNPSSNIFLNYTFTAQSDPNKLPDNWGSYYWGPNPIAVSVSSNGHQTGYKSLKISGAGIQSGGVLQWINSLKPNTEYTATAWVQIESIASTVTSGISMTVNIGGGSPSKGVYIPTILTDGSWIPITMVFKTGADTSKAFIYPVMVHNFTGTLFVSDVRLFEGNKPLNLTHIFAREYDKALMIYRPLMQANGKWDESTAYNLSLSKKYRRLSVDGSLSIPTNILTLRAYEAAFLIPEAVIMLGDVSGDKRITAYDASLVKKYLADSIANPLTADQTKRADVDGQAGVSEADAALIAKKAVGLIEKFPVEGI